jgi:hypothetical protein
VAEKFVPGIELTPSEATRAVLLVFFFLLVVAVRRVQEGFPLLPARIVPLSAGHRDEVVGLLASAFLTVPP